MNIENNSVLLRVSFSRAGNDRKASLDSVETEADKRRLRMVKKLFTCKEYTAIQSFDIKLTTWLDSRAIPCDVGYRGIKLLPLSLLSEVENRLNEAATERTALVSEFLQVYDTERTKAQAELKEFFDHKNYPPVGTVAEKFGIEWWYVTFKVPETLPEGLRQEQQAKLEERFSNMETDVRNALRETLNRLMETLVDQLKPESNGKKRRFYDSSIENLSEFLRLFSVRNVTNDTELNTLAAAAEQIIAGATGETIRKDQSLRASLHDRASEILEAVSNLVQTQSNRKFKLDDDEF